MSMRSGGKARKGDPDTLPRALTSGIPFTVKSPMESAIAASTLSIACEKIQ